MFDQVTAITTCKGRLHHLQQSLPLLMQLAIPVVVVDYDCPQQTQAWVKQYYPQAEVVWHRDQPHFCLSKARNSGAAVAKTKYLFFIDADVLINPKIARQFFNELRPQQLYLAPEPRLELTGTCLCARKDYLRIEGYDVVLQGYGADDLDFYERLKYVGVTEQLFPREMLQQIKHSAAVRTQYSDTPDLDYSRTRNLLYMRIKLDLMKFTERELPLSLRSALFEQVEQLLKAPDPAVPLNLQIRYRNLQLAQGAFKFEMKISPVTAPAEPSIKFPELPPS